MSNRKLEWSKRVTVRMPEALYVDLQDLAESHRRTLNQEIVAMLIRPRGRELHKALMGLEPTVNDTRTDKEIAAEIEWLHGSDMSWAVHQRNRTLRGAYAGRVGSA